MLKKLGKYEIIEELGRGAMGIVYKGKDPMIGRLLAIKTITASLADQPELLERFFREAQAAGQMNHPNIVTIYDMGNEAGTPFIAMEFLEGESLEGSISRKDAVPLSLKVNYMLQVCRGLDYAHRRGVVHRDIKPANVVVTKDGTIKVVDFGIARVVDTSKTQTGVLMGTVGYMSPEQVRGEKVDGRSDIWSTGVMFYELLVGRRPFHGDNFAAVMLAIITQEPKPLKDHIPDIPPELDAVLQKFLKKDITERYQNMDEAVLELEPMWRKLQQFTVGDLLTRGQQLVKEHDLPKARDVLRQVLQMDGTNTQAKTLLEKVNAELKRELILPQVKDHVAKAEALLREGKYEEARSAGEAALKLDSVYEPAQVVMRAVQEAADRAKQLNSLLHSSKQQLAEGALTQADINLDKILELSAEHPEARALKKQLATEMARRETRQKLQDGLQRARNLWTQQKFDDSIATLDDLLQEFPNDTDVKKLLETVHEDKAEQQKHTNLAEARNLLASGKYDQAVSILDSILQQHPEEHAAQKLRQHVLQEKKESERRQVLEHEQAELKKLISSERYGEVVAKGEKLLKDYPEDFELAKLVEYARTQQAQVEQSRKLQDRMKELRDLLDKKNYDQAVKAGEQALEAFPSNVDLLKMVNEARTQLKEKEKRDYVEKQIRSMKASIDTGNLTDAIDLGRQTLAQVKHDTDVTRLLHFAEREVELRDKEIDKGAKIENATVLMSAAKFEEAVALLKDVEKTHVFDPRVHELLKAAKEKKAPPPVDGTVVGTPGMINQPAGPGASVETQYVFRTPGPPPAKPVDEPAGIKAQASAPGVESIPTPGRMPPPAAPPKVEPGKAEPVKVTPVAPPEVKPPRKEEKKKKGAIVEEPEVKKEEKPPVAAGPAVYPPAPPKVEPPAPPKAPARVEPPPAVQPPPPPRPAPAEVKAPPRVEPRFAPPVEAPKAGMSPAVMGGIGVAVLAAAIGGYMMIVGGSTTTTPPGTGTTSSGTSTTADPAAAKQAGLKKEADALADAEKFDDAIKKVDEALALNGPMNAELKKLRQNFVDGKANISLLREEKKLWDKAMSDFNANRFPAAKTGFQAVLKLKEGGRRRGEAEKYLSETLPNREGEERNFSDAKKLLDKGDPASLQSGVTLLKQVVALNGPRKGEADSLMTKANERISQFGKDEIIKGMMTSGQNFIRAGDIASARRVIAEIRAQGGDPSSLEGQITAAEQSQFRGLETQFTTLRGRKDQAGLASLIGDARRVADGGGSQSTNASQLIENINTAINDLKKEASDNAENERRVREKADWDAAERGFNAAKNSQNEKALNGAVKDALTGIANSASTYAGQADTLLKSIPTVVAGWWSCKPIPKSTGGDLAGEKKAGMMVPVAYLDSTLAWADCPKPPLPSGSGLISLTIVIGEDGSVAEVKARAAGTVDPAILDAMKKWRANAGPKFKGLDVKTSFSYDIRY